MSRFELVCTTSCQIGECPVWFAERAELVFVDVIGRRVYGFTPASGVLRSLEIEEDIGFVAPRRAGGFLAGLRSGVWLLDADGGKCRRLARNPADPRSVRFNDGGIDAHGRLLIGTIDETRREGRAGLYRLDAHGLTELVRGLMTSNGVAFSPDGRTLYHADTPRFVIYQCDYEPETGTVGNRRVFAQLDPGAPDRGRPDGAAVDSQGCYWSALYEGSRLIRLDPTGRLIGEYPLPARRPTMAVFGGPHLKTLYVTTARAADGSGGGVYALPVDTAGLPHPLFDEESFPP